MERERESVCVREREINDGIICHKEMRIGVMGQMEMIIIIIIIIIIIVIIIIKDGGKGRERRKEGKERKGKERKGKKEMGGMREWERKKG